jgi:hypothetical protein
MKVHIQTCVCALKIPKCQENSRYFHNRMLYLREENMIYDDDVLVLFLSLVLLELRF